MDPVPEDIDPLSLREAGCVGTDEEVRRGRPPMAGIVERLLA
jgi:hypothetical protein